MSFPYLNQHERIQFPHPREADEYGILCTGGNLSPGMLLSAYEQGIFPWFSEHEPILWWSPDPRFVLNPQDLHIPSSLKRYMRRRQYTVTCDTAFSQVVQGCAQAPRPGQDGTWITQEMIEGYVELHELGYAHSFEVWHHAELAGGLYGVSLGDCFFGESMFSRMNDASKTGFVTGVRYMQAQGIELIDSQVRTDHVERFGAREIRREEYLFRLHQCLEGITRKGPWTADFSMFTARSMEGQKGITAD
ncbi:MAG: leucyl/phenylalanyl-tRNA--protein transferase [Spirochaetales bacterium]|nr:leucyl/phenylalanyl-tRNA--protein transferase [Spirochaetales bacterium]